MRYPPLLLAAVFYASMALASGSNLVLNGDVSQDANGRGWPDHWNREPGMTWETQDGRRFLRLSVPEPGKMLAAFRRAPIPEGCRGVDVGIRYRTSNVKPGAEPWYDCRVILHCVDAAGKTLLPEPRPISLSGTAAAWTEAGTRLLLPAGTAQLQVMPSLYRVAAGTLDIANLSVTPIPAEESSRMEAKRDARLQHDAAVDAAVARDLQRAPVTPEIKVEGNRLETLDGKPVWLQGVNVCGLEWRPDGENPLRSIKVAVSEWKANVIRLPVDDAFWFGRGKNQTPGGISAQAYRDLVDRAIKLAAANGAYVILDLHRYQAPREEHLVFWKDAATRYKNNPAVLFDLLNEPHNIAWDVWLHGGPVVSKERGEEGKTYQSPGMQAMVDAVRSTGARNVIVAGALDWAYDLSGIANGYALQDREPGNGIMYSSHVYFWKRDWQGKFLFLASRYPLLIGECGADFEHPNIPKSLHEDPHTWAPDMLGLIQKYHLNWTAWSFHVSARPVILEDWNYTPTPHWGAYVKDALQGKAFELKKMR